MLNNVRRLEHTTHSLATSKRCLWCADIVVVVAIHTSGIFVMVHEMSVNEKQQKVVSALSFTRSCSDDISAWELDKQ